MRNPVLVVDDDEDVRKAVSDLLSMHGFAVLTAQDGREALGLLRAHGACCIVLDLMMPTMDGADFRRAQLADSRIAHVPYILLTGKLNLGFSAAVGAIDCLRKPFQPSDLIAAVRRAQAQFDEEQQAASGFLVPRRSTI